LASKRRRQSAPPQPEAPASRPRAPRQRRATLPLAAPPGDAPPSAASGPAPADRLREILERVGQITRDNQGLFQELMASERRFRRLAKAVWQVQEEERRRLARELHDGLGQNLTALKYQLELLEHAAGNPPPDLRERLGGAVELAARSLADTRELSHLLRPTILDDLGLMPALRWLVRTLRQRTGLEVRFSGGLEDGEAEERLDPDLETLIFRVVQEALTNVLKHSGVRVADLDLRRRGKLLALRIADRGAGFEEEAVFGQGAAGGDGCGLRGIRDRVELFGGRCRVRSAPGSGTSLEIELPLSAAGREG
jgi:two-component system NarL family sensor kinase